MLQLQPQPILLLTSCLNASNCGAKFEYNILSKNKDY